MRPLRVDTAGVRAMAARWAASGRDLDAVAPPAGFGAARQASALPDLSQLLAWPTSHLTEAADHWETVGARIMGLPIRFGATH